MNPDQRRAWGPVVQLAREAAGLTQDQLADLAGTTRQTISAIESQKNAGQPAKLERILEVLGLNALTDKPDVEAFIAQLRPLLRKLSPDELHRVMAAIVDVVAEALPQQRAIYNTAGLPGVTAGEVARRWVEQWADGRTDGPWHVRGNATLDDGLARFEVDVAVLTESGDLAAVFELKRHDAKPAAIEQQVFRIQRALRAAGMPDVDVVGLQASPPTSPGPSERSTIGEVMRSLSEGLFVAGERLREPNVELGLGVGLPDLADTDVDTWVGEGRPRRRAMSSFDEDGMAAAARSEDAEKPKLSDN